MNKIFFLTGCLLMLFFLASGLQASNYTAQQILDNLPPPDIDYKQLPVKIKSPVNLPADNINELTGLKPINKRQKDKLVHQILNKVNKSVSKLEKTILPFSLSEFGKNKSEAGESELLEKLKKQQEEIKRLKALLKRKSITKNKYKAESFNESTINNLHKNKHGFRKVVKTSKAVSKTKKQSNVKNFKNKKNSDKEEGVKVSRNNEDKSDNKHRLEASDNNSNRVRKSDNTKENVKKSEVKRATKVNNKKNNVHQAKKEAKQNNKSAKHSFDAVFIKLKKLEAKGAWKKIKSVLRANKAACKTEKGLIYQIKYNLNGVKKISYAKIGRFGSQLLKLNKKSSWGNYAKALSYYYARKPKVDKALQYLQKALNAKKPADGASAMYWKIKLKKMWLIILIIIGAIIGGIDFLIKKKRKNTAISENSDNKNSEDKAKRASPLNGKLQNIKAKILNIFAKFKKKKNVDLELSENTTNQVNGEDKIETEKNTKDNDENQKEPEPSKPVEAVEGSEAEEKLSE